MPTALIFAATVLIWGSTWIMVKLQLGIVPATVSIVYRFALASIALMIFAWWQGRRLSVPAKHLPMVAVQGTLMFSANYYFIYAGTAYLPSGMVSVLFTTLVLFNLVGERLFFGTRISATSIVAGGMALGGVALMFWRDIDSISLEDNTVRGVVLTMTAVLMASLGNMAAMRNTRKGLPVVAVNAIGMAFGAGCSWVVAAVAGDPFIIDTSFRYLGSLLFLAIPGTAIAFGMYLWLLDKLGGGKSAYVSVMLPIVALLISTVFEDYRWNMVALTGLAIAVAGNALALTEKRSSQRPRSA